MNGFAVQYVEDWEAWLAAPRDFRPGLFGQILRGTHSSVGQKKDRPRDPQHEERFHRRFEEVFEKGRSVLGRCFETAHRQLVIHKPGQEGYRGSCHAEA